MLPMMLQKYENEAQTTFCQPGEGCYCADSCITWNPEDASRVCNGHFARRFIYECNLTCFCEWSCGNRVVQRGMPKRVELFWTGRKGWGVRTLQPVPTGSFLFEYVGQVCTNSESLQREKDGTRTYWYTLSLDADWKAEAAANDRDALCLDGTLYGNVARFVNHRCEDANLVDVPVKINFDSPYNYHVAFFAKRNIRAL